MRYNSFWMVWMVWMAIAGLLFAIKEPALAQSPEPDSSNWEFSILGGFSTFSLDGQFQVFEAPVAFGAAYTPNVFDIGLFLAPVVHVEEEDVQVTLSTMLHARAFKKFGFGFGYTFWQSQIGLIEPQKPNLFFVLSYELVGPETTRQKRAQAKKSKFPQ